MTRPRDTQRSKVYAINPALGRNKLTLAECEDLICRAHERYGLKWRGRVSDGRGTSTARGSSWRINLPLWARTPETVLHETAHAIVDGQHGSNRLAAHGPEYARVFIELLAWAKLDTLPNLRKQCRTLGVKVAADAACVPPKVTALSDLKKATAEMDAAKKAYDASVRRYREAHKAVHGY